MNNKILNYLDILIKRGNIATPIAWQKVILATLLASLKAKLAPLIKRA